MRACPNFVLCFCGKPPTLARSAANHYVTVNHRRQVEDRTQKKFFGITLKLGYQAQSYAFASDINCVVYVRL